MQPRNLFTTKTMQGVWALVAAFLVEATPMSNAFIDRKFDKNTAEDLKFYLALTLVLVGVSRASYGRHQATQDVFTPLGLPGRRKNEVRSNK